MLCSLDNKCYRCVIESGILKVAKGVIVGKQVRTLYALFGITIEGVVGEILRVCNLDVACFRSLRMGTGLSLA